MTSSNGTQTEGAYLLGTPLALALLNYLATRPYAEVHELIASLQSLERVPLFDAEKA